MKKIVTQESAGESVGSNRRLPREVVELALIRELEELEHRICVIADHVGYLTDLAGDLQPEGDR